MVYTERYWVFGGIGVAFMVSLGIHSLMMAAIRSHQEARSLHFKGKKRKANKRPRIVFFGSSTTQQGWNVDRHGWVAKLAHWWSRRVDVVNRGLSGYNTRWAKQVMNEWILDEPLDMLFLFFGGNDAAIPSSNQHVPLEEYRENMRSIVQQVRVVSPAMSNCMKNVLLFTCITSAYHFSRFLSERNIPKFQSFS